jgi:hypothetical protein
MPDSYPYTISNNKVEPVLARIRTAAKPERFGHALLKTWGFTASNDRAMVSIFKELGFLTENGAPTAEYDHLRDQINWKFVLADAIRRLYSDLYSIDPNFHALPEAEIKSAMMRITGKDEETVKRYYATFKTFAGLANFAPRRTQRGRKASDESTDPVTSPLAPASPPSTLAPAPAPAHEEPHRVRKSEYHYNIQIHLPVTADITVYNAHTGTLPQIEVDRIESILTDWIRQVG